jgi:hypothetical protein
MCASQEQTMGIGRPFQQRNKIGRQWQPGQSGNPTGKPSALVVFERKFAEALANQGSPKELAEMIWNAARRGESWAILKLSERFEWQREHPADDGKVEITVTYVQQNRIGITGAAPSADEGDSGGAAVQHPCLRPAFWEDNVGDESSDPAGAGGQTDGMVQPDLPPAE